eukprot:351831-Chlamydomonas_euryale.AAC.8
MLEASLDLASFAGVPPNAQDMSRPRVLCGRVRPQAGEWQRFRIVMVETSEALNVVALTPARGSRAGAECAVFLLAKVWKGWSEEGGKGLQGGAWPWVPATHERHCPK